MQKEAWIVLVVLVLAFGGWFFIGSSDDVGLSPATKFLQRLTGFDDRVVGDVSERGVGEREVVNDFDNSKIDRFVGDETKIKALSNIIENGADIEIEGDIEVFVMEDFESGFSESVYFLNSDNKRYRIFSLEDELLRFNGKTVKVRGQSLNDQLVVSSLKEPIEIIDVGLSPGDETLGNQRIATILVNFQNDPSEPYTSSDAFYHVLDEGNPLSAASYYREVSFGKTWLTGDVYGWVNAQYSDDDCRIWQEHYMQKLIDEIDPLIDFAQYDRLMVFQPRNLNCGFVGYSSLGKVAFQTDEGILDLSLSISNYDSLVPELTVHEMGHGFGLAHASYYDCGDVSVDDFCHSSEYGDGFDVMGRGDMAHFNAPHKEQLGWFDSGNIVDVVSSDSFYLLSNLEQSTNEIQVIRIPANYYITELYGSVNYYLEYRENVGFDSGLVNEDGLLIHIDKKDLWDYSEHSTTLLIDSNPLTSSSDVFVGLGETYEDGEKGIKISPLEVIDEKLKVHVELTKYCGNGVVDSSIGEECDGSQLLGESCEYMGYLSGNLGCTDQCKLDTSSCASFVCGEGHTYDDESDLCVAEFISDFNDGDLGNSDIASGGSWIETREDDTALWMHSEYPWVFLLNARRVDGKSWIYRMSFPFDTSSLPDNSQLASSDLTIKVLDFGGVVNSHPNSKDYISLVNVELDNTPFLSFSDYDNFGDLDFPVEGAQRIDISEADVPGIITFNLNEEGLSWINEEGWTSLGIRAGYDIENYYVPNEETRLSFYSRSSDSPIFGPRLVVKYFPLLISECGNNICELGEDSNSCLADCPLGFCTPGHVFDEVSGVCTAEISDVNEDGYIRILGGSAGDSSKIDVTSEVIQFSQYQPSSLYEFGYIEWDISSVPSSALVSGVSMKYKGLTSADGQETIRSLDLSQSVVSLTSEEISTAFLNNNDAAVDPDSGYVSLGTRIIEILAQEVDELQSRVETNKDYYAVATVGEGSNVYVPDVTISSSEDVGSGPKLIVEYSMCGDGVCSENEDIVSCSADCGQPVCGDGLIEESEECDDLNTLEGDGCDSNCEVETGWSCSGAPSVCLVDLYISSNVFLTSQAWAGSDLGGISGADQKCLEAAQNVGLEGNYRAWISDSSSSVSDRFVHSQDKYTRLDGKIVADDWSDLVDGSIDRAIDLTETGETSLNGAVWTGTTSVGTSSVYNCEDWTGSEGGNFGDVRFTDQGWTFQSGPGNCEFARSLYCFEVVCGNGVVEPGEECDGNDFSPDSCQDHGYDSGDVTCSSSCSFDFSDCRNDVPVPFEKKEVDKRPVDEFPVAVGQGELGEVPAGRPSEGEVALSPEERNRFIRWLCRWTNIC